MQPGGGGQTGAHSDEHTLKLTPACPNSLAQGKNQVVFLRKENLWHCTGIHSLETRGIDTTYLFFELEDQQGANWKGNLPVTKNTLGPGMALLLWWPSQVSPGKWLTRTKMPPC